MIQHCFDIITNNTSIKGYALAYPFCLQKLLGKKENGMNSRKQGYRKILIILFVAVVMFTVYYTCNVIKLEVVKEELKNNQSIQSVDNTTAEVMLMPLGIQIGVYLETDGVLVASTSSITGLEMIHRELEP